MHQNSIMNVEESGPSFYYQAKCHNWGGKENAIDYNHALVKKWKAIGAGELYCVLEKQDESWRKE